MVDIFNFVVLRPNEEKTNVQGTKPPQRYHQTFVSVHFTFPHVKIQPSNINL